MSSKPTIVLVSGAFHIPAHFSELIKLLQAAGYKTVAEKNPSCDAANAFVQDVNADIAALRENVLLPQINAGKEVVLVMHSYGGKPGAAAATGLSKAELSAAGKPGGIVGLIFIAAFIAQEGESLLSKLPGQKLEPWQVYDESDGQISVLDPKSIFYADVPSPDDELAISQLKKQSILSFATTSPKPAWVDPFYDGRRSYFSTLQDAAIPPIAQEMMLKGSGVEWNVKSFDSSHSPFLSHPEELSAWIVDQARAFASKS